mmetsp:Transcript_46672/g.77204  ORF Transcript_46672/g.77204 Transcript_46672/m.77204 type:complete len:215 (-) Transcript_46672:478-1122(-)
MRPRGSTTLSSSGRRCVEIRCCKCTPGVSYSLEPPEKASIAIGERVVPGVPDEIGRRGGLPAYEASRNAEMKSDLPTFAAPITNTSLPLRTPRISFDASLMPIPFLADTTSTSMTPPIRASPTCASHWPTACSSVSLGSRSTFVPTSTTGLAPIKSRTRGKSVPATSVKSTSNTTRALRSRNGRSCARSSSGEVTPFPPALRSRPSATAGRIWP